MNINYDDPIKNLPDAFKKDTDSNNYKLLQINKGTTDILKSISADLFNALNISNAKGKVLDDIYGGRAHLQRGTLSDEQYIIRLRFKMMQNIVNGSFPDLIESLSYVLQCDKSEIRIVESDTENAVIVKDMPVSMMQKAGFTIYQINDLINQLLPIGVYVLEFSYEKKSLLPLHIGGFVLQKQKSQAVRLEEPGDREVCITQGSGGFAACITKYQTISI